MSPLGPAERLLVSLGVTGPKDIDLEAIAYCVGVEVRRRQLDSCEARIVGAGDRAIITVRSGGYEARTRFSIGHELGHWEHHRGRSFVCRREDIGRPDTPGPMNPERVADRYAADLLMPEYLFRPRVRATKRPTFELVDEVRSEFGTSRTATAMRLVDLSDHPCLLVCHSQNGRTWFRAGPDVPKKWFPQSSLDADSSAMGVVFGSDTRTAPTLVGADAWFDCRGASEFTLYEQTVKQPNGDGLTLLVLSDKGMLRS